MSIIREIIFHKTFQLLQQHVVKATLMKRSFKNVLLHVISLAFIALPSVVFSWPSDTSINTPISLAAGDQADVVIAEDGDGGAIMAWKDYRNSDSSDIYIQRVDSTGAVLWALDGVPLCTATDRQSDPVIIADGNGGAIFTWNDRRDGSEQIYAQRFDANGNAQWTANGIHLANLSSPVSIISDGVGGAILVWKDINNEGYAQRINADGDILWTTASLKSAIAVDPLITSDGSGGAIITFVVSGTGSFAQRLDANGNILWTAGGVLVDSLGSYFILADGEGGAVIFLRGTLGYYAQKINASGLTQWPEAVWLASGGSWDVYTFTGNGQGGAFISWWVNASGEYDDFNNLAIYAQGVDTDGNLRYSTDGLLVGYRPYGSGRDVVPIVSDNAGGFIASWVMTDNNNDWDIYGQRYSADGLPVWEGSDPVIVSSATGVQGWPVIVGDGSGGAIFAWHDRRNGDQQDIYAQKMSSDGYPAGLKTPFNISPVDGNLLDTLPTLSASEFIDESAVIAHAASQWRINNINSITPETPEDSLAVDDGSFEYQLPFSFPFFGRNITSIDVNANGLIELLEDGEKSYETGDYGTHFDGDHINNMDAIFAANDDLVMENGYMRLYNAGSQVVIEWYGTTFIDYDNGNVANTMLFQVELHQDGTIAWNFSQLDYNSFEYGLYSGVYPNGGVEIDMTDTYLGLLDIPASFEFDPVTRTTQSISSRWYEAQPVTYDSTETTDLVSHLVPDTAGLEDAVTYYWGVRYKGDNDEWTGWSSTTSFSLDITGPTVITPTQPENLATDVVINTVIQATFSEQMDATTIDTDSFTLSTSPGGQVAGSVSYDGITAVFAPSSDLAYNTGYLATITTAVTDTMGNQMLEPEIWSFTTGLQADLIPPYVEFSLPAADAAGVAINITSIDVTFSETINASTVNKTSFTLTGPVGVVAGTVAYDAVSDTAHFDPDANLAYSTMYTVTVTRDIEDNAGNAMAVEDSWTFSTANEPPPQQDSVAPRVVSMSPDGTGLVSSSVGAVAVTFSEPIQQFDNTSFVVSSAGDAVAGTVQYDESAMTAWFYPAADFDFNTSYTVRVYSLKIRDLSDNYMSLDFLGFFTTSGNPIFEGCNPEIGEEGACESFDHFTYGTGAAVNTYGSSISGPTAEYAARRDLSYGQSLTDKKNEPPSTAFESRAVARVDSTGFSLRSLSRRMELSDDLAGTWSMGASKIDVSGVPPGTLIPMSIVLSGYFTGNGGTLLLQVHDFDDYRGLGSMSVVGSGDSVTYTQMIDPYAINSGDAANYVRTPPVDSDINIRLNSSNRRLDFLYPAVPNNGLYVWFVAGVHSTLSSVKTEFTATLEVNPPPGVTVTLASGQVFTGELDTDGDGVADSVDTDLDNAAVASPASVSGTGNIIMDVSDIAGATLSQVEVLDDDDLSLVQDGKPADMVFPDGLVSFRLNGLSPGETVKVTLAFPTPFPDNARYYKVNETGFYELPYPDADFDYDNNTVTLTITDGGFGDNDDVANGVIVDPGGIGVVTATDDTGSSSGGGGGAFGLLMLFAMFLMSMLNLSCRRRSQV